MTPAAVLAGPARWLELRGRVQPGTLRPGATGIVVVEADVPEGGHIEAHEPPEPFLIPTVLRFEGLPDDLEVGPPRYPAPVERTLAWSPAVLRVYRGTVRFEAEVRVLPRARPGRRTLTAELSYQACTETVCLPPSSERVEITIEVGSTEVGSAAVDGPETPRRSGPPMRGPGDRPGTRLR